jgi:hypothetical protein
VEITGAHDVVAVEHAARHVPAIEGTVNRNRSSFQDVSGMLIDANLIVNGDEMLQWGQRAEDGIFVAVRSSDRLLLFAFPSYLR